MEFAPILLLFWLLPFILIAYFLSLMSRVTRTLESVAQSLKERDKTP